jgi:hypothetical protein
LNPMPSMVRSDIENKKRPRVEFTPDNEDFSTVLDLTPDELLEKLNQRVLLGVLTPYKKSTMLSKFIALSTVILKGEYKHGIAWIAYVKKKT